MKKIPLTLVVVFNFLVLPLALSETSYQRTLASEISFPKLEYPENQSEYFIEEDEFYNELDKNIYEEYKNAAYSMREKISFNDVPETELTFKLKTKLGGVKMNPTTSLDIHPNRQVYFMASFHQNEKEEWHKFVVIDAKTKKVLLGGNHYHIYYNPYK